MERSLLEQELPELGLTRPSITRPSVVLPDPDSPTRPSVSPGPICSDTPMTAGTATRFQTGPVR
jgi:hypothetical protein